MQHSISQPASGSDPHIQLIFQQHHRHPPLITLIHVTVETGHTEKSGKNAVGMCLCCRPIGARQDVNVVAN